MKKIITIILFIAFGCGCGPSREEIKQKNLLQNQLKVIEQQGQNTRLIRIGTYEIPGKRSVVCLQVR